MDGGRGGSQRRR